MSILRRLMVDYEQAKEALRQHSLFGAMDDIEDVVCSRFIEVLVSNGWSVEPWESSISGPHEDSDVVAVEVCITNDDMCLLKVRIVEANDSFRVVKIHSGMDSISDSTRLMIHISTSIERDIAERLTNDD